MPLLELVEDRDPKHFIDYLASKMKSELSALPVFYEAVEEYAHKLDTLYFEIPK